jgi:hypothetical protein
LYGSTGAGNRWQPTGTKQALREERELVTICGYDFLPLPRMEEEAYARRRAAKGGASIISDEGVRGSSRGLRRPEEGVFA